MFERILVGLDGSKGSMRAMEVAAEIAHQFDASLRICSVIEHEPRFAGTVGEVEETDRAAEEYFEQIQDLARHVARKHEVHIDVSTLRGSPAQVLAEETTLHNYDLLVLGHSGHSGVWSPFLGTTADKAIRHASCSVLVVR